MRWAVAMLLGVLLAPFPATGETHRVSAPTAPIDWETGHPERRSWTRDVLRVARRLLPGLDKAQDIALIVYGQNDWTTFTAHDAT